MNDRMINVIKWVFISMGVMFLLEIFLIIGAWIALVKYANTDFSFDEIIYQVTKMY